MSGTPQTLAQCAIFILLLANTQILVASKLERLSPLPLAEILLITVKFLLLGEGLLLIRFLGHFFCVLIFHLLISLFGWTVRISLAAPDWTVPKI